MYNCVKARSHYTSNEISEEYTDDNTRMTHSQEISNIQIYFHLLVMIFRNRYNLLFIIVLFF